MTLIAILFCLGVQRFANVGGLFRISWFESYLKLLNPWIAKLDKRLAILAIVAPILVAIFLLQMVFGFYLHGLLNLIFAAVVLFFCIDARGFKNRLKAYFAGMEQDDLHGAATAAAEFIGESPAENKPDLSRAVTKAIIAKSFEQIFSSLFWFMVFGVYGLATYFVIVLLSQHGLKINSGYAEIVKLAEKIQEVFEWIPSRLLGFTYSLAGCFSKGFGYFIKNISSGLAEVKKFVVESGVAALDLDPNDEHADQKENVAAIDLVDRAVLVWLVALVLIVVGMWL